MRHLKTIAVSLGIASNVTFAGNVQSPASFYESCHVGLHPSSAEVGYSLAILEYMRAGLPVVVPNNLSVCRATTDGVDGLVYSEDDEEDAANKVALILGNEDLRRSMAVRARKRVTVDFRLESTHAQLLAAVDAALGRES